MTEKLSLLKSANRPAQRLNVCDLIAVKCLILLEASAFERIVSATGADDFGLNKSPREIFSRHPASA